MKQTILIICLVACASVSAQNVYTGAYRSDANPYYWKNKKPNAAYWQQDVEYKINAYIDERTNIITASEELKYYNNSPDTLHVLFFHLYQNAFVKGSYLEQLAIANKQRPVFGKYEAQGLGTTVDNLMIDGMLPAGITLDNTVMRVELTEPLYPDDSLTVSMDFKTYFDKGSLRRRMAAYPSWGWTHYNGVHWYPRISVYDQRKSWDQDQHLNKELYGDFGSFDVKLNFANNYIVEATGLLQNKDEVLPDSLLEKLEARNFAGKMRNTAPSVIIPYDTAIRKTWHYYSVNTHDFAFTADPSYRYRDTTADGVHSIGLVQEPHALYWQNSADYVRKIIKVYSEDFGDYVYPKIIAADANDGMEYPMLTLDGGGDPGYRRLLAHEIGHNWFYGMLGNNETYRAMLDEGFTQFLTSWAIKKIDGPLGYINPLPRNFILRFIEQRRYHPRVEYSNNYFKVYQDWLDGEMVDMNRHSNDYHSAMGHENGYGQVYYKPSTMLYNLQYVLGDSLFQAGMRHYVSQWRMAHPYVQDFRNSIREVAKVDMDWFFDQWIETGKRQDFKLKYLKRRKDGVHVTIKRKQAMVSPIDFSLISRSGDTVDYHIPIRDFHKETDAIILPKWFGSDKVNRKYKVVVPFEGKLKGGVIDKTLRLADMNLMNNSRYRAVFPREKFKLKLDLKPKDLPYENKYLILWRPLLGQNNKDGLRPGLDFNGSFMNRMNMFDFKFFYKTYIITRDSNLVKETTFKRRVDYTFTYSTIFPRAPRLRLDLYSAHLEGLNDNRAMITFRTLQNWNIGLKARRMDRFDNDYLQMAGQWGTEADSLAVNNYLEISVQKDIKMYKGVSELLIKYRNLGLLADLENKSLPYSFTSAEWKWYRNYGKLLLRTRLFGRAGGEVLHKETALFLGGANTEEMMDNKYFRSRSMLGGIEISDMPSNFQMGGGLNLRAYSAYDLVLQTPNGPMYALKGNYGFAGTWELDLDGLVNWKPFLLDQLLHVDFYPFLDVGAIGQKNVNDLNRFSGILADAGVGIDFVVKRFFKVDDVHPLVFRFDFPFFMSNPPPTQSKFDLRYVIGISRTF